MKAIIIDDERLARTELRKLLQDFPEIEIVDEASNADEGIQKIENYNPDLIFLDLKLPGISMPPFTTNLPMESAGLDSQGNQACQ